MAFYSGSDRKKVWIGHSCGWQERIQRSEILMPNTVVDWLFEMEHEHKHECSSFCEEHDQYDCGEDHEGDISEWRNDGAHGRF